MVVGADCYDLWLQSHRPSRRPYNGDGVEVVGAVVVSVAVVSVVVLVVLVVELVVVVVDLVLDVELVLVVFIKVICVIV